MSHLLDSSAWLAHLFGEPGVDEINILFNDPNTQVSISALSIPEVFARLKVIGRETHWADVWAIYSELFFRVIEADEAIAHRAVQLRAATPKRLPTIDGLIAATALLRRLTLVHCDPHMAAIADSKLRQMHLPNK
ncbi:MAG: PIN domain-containing protein [Chloroflexota bacterium]|nr:PIN domain-containing protein [Chloroflexota bacterium]